MRRSSVDYGRNSIRKQSNPALNVRSLIKGIFACQHKEMSRPFSRHGESYRVCLTCGAHRNFNEQTWQTVGPYYYSGAQNVDLAKRDPKTGPNFVKAA